MHVVFGPDRLSPQELEKVYRVQDKLNIDQRTLTIEAVRQFIRRIRV